MRYQSLTPPTYLLAALVGAGILAATVTACDTQPDAQYVGVCVDRVTQQRVPDDQCGLYGDTGGAVALADEWDYIDTVRYPTYLVPAYGRRINTTNITVVHNAPTNVTVYRGVSRSGGAASTFRTPPAVARVAGSGSLNQGTTNSSSRRSSTGGSGRAATRGR